MIELLAIEPRLFYDEVADAVYQFSGKLYSTKQVQASVSSKGITEKVLEERAIECDQQLEIIWLEAVNSRRDGGIPAHSYLFLDEMSLKPKDARRRRGIILYII